MTIVAHPTETSPAALAGDFLAPGIDSSWDHTDWQRVWLRTQRLQWRTLALVPGDERVSTLDVATILARLAFDHGEMLRVADARGLRPKDVEAFLYGCRWETDQGKRIVFATWSTATNAVTVPIARSADCVILCASLGSTSMKDIRSTVDDVGKEYFHGSLLVSASMSARSMLAPAVAGA